MTDTPTVTDGDATEDQLLAEIKGGIDSILKNVTETHDTVKATAMTLDSVELKVKNIQEDTKFIIDQIDKS